MIQNKSQNAKPFVKGNPDDCWLHVYFDGVDYHIPGDGWMGWIDANAETVEARKRLCREVDRYSPRAVRRGSR